MGNNQKVAEQSWIDDVRGSEGGVNINEKVEQKSRLVEKTFDRFTYIKKNISGVDSNMERSNALVGSATLSL